MGTGIQMAEHGATGRSTSALDILAGKGSKGGLRRLLPSWGRPSSPASPTSTRAISQPTSREGRSSAYTLLWVIVASNLMAMLIQTLAAKLGIATGLNLAEHCRKHFPRPVVLLMWVLMEMVAMATDLARIHRGGGRLQPAVRHAAAGLPGLHRASSPF